MILKDNKEATIFLLFFVIFITLVLYLSQHKNSVCDARRELAILEGQPSIDYDACVREIKIRELKEQTK